jgi:hypothetical protein
MQHKTFNWLAAAGFISDIPALTIVASGMLQVVFGLTGMADALAGNSLLRVVNNPITVLGGLLFAIGLNVIPIFRLRLEYQQGAVQTVITTHLRLLNIAVLCLSIFLFTAILMYAFGENFIVVKR